MTRCKGRKSTKGTVSSGWPLPADGVPLESFIPLCLVRRTCRKEVITPIDAPQAFVEEARQEQKVRRVKQVSPLQRALGLAHHWQRLLDERRVDSLGEIAKAEGIDVTQVRRLLRLTLLAPDIVERLTRDRQALLDPIIRQAFPIKWDDQRCKQHSQ